MKEKEYIKLLSIFMFTFFICGFLCMIYYTLSSDRRRNITSKMNIAILIPTTTRTIKSPKLEALSLMKFCLPSIVDTMESVYNYTVYLGIDKGDYLRTVEAKIVHKFPFVKLVHIEGGTITKAVNEIANISYNDNMMYMVRLTDDTRLLTQNWTSAGIQILKNYVPSNIGVVGPTCGQGNTAILTNDMVHRTHIDIFHFYYPPEFENWWNDDWITNVYKPNRSIKLKFWEVHHNMIQGTRYKVDFTTKKRLLKMNSIDKRRLDRYICSVSKMCR